MQISLPKTHAARYRIVRIISNGTIGLGAGAFASSAIFETVQLAPYWVGFCTGAICAASTAFGAGFGLIYKTAR